MTVQSQATVGSYAPWSMRLVGVGLLAVTLTLAIQTVRPDGNVVDWTELPVFGGMFTVMLIFGTRCSVLPRISWDSSGVTVHNPMRILTLPWSEIEDFVPGSFALRINTTNGKHVGVWAVQRANAAKPGRSVVDLLAIKLREVKLACKLDSTGKATSRVKLPWAELAVIICYLVAGFAFRINH
jgi:Bacterial PH domain